jgi:two-component system OmpR family response regulator
MGLMGSANLPGPAARVLLVDDDVELASMLREYLQREGFETTAVHDGETGAREALSGGYAIVVLDVMLPRLSGVEALRRIRMQSRVPVLMLTAKGDDVDRIVGLEMGADDYVVKPFSPRELVLRVKAVLKRAHRDDLSDAGAVSFERGTLVLDGHRYEVKRKGEPVNLTPSEFKVLFALASNPDRVMTRGELVEKALGYQFEGYERSVDAHVKNIRQKIQDDPRNPSFILTVYGLGYKFIGKRDD